MLVPNQKHSRVIQRGSSCMKAEVPIYRGGVTEPQIHHEHCEFLMLLNPICLRQEALGALCSLSDL
jgi:hypothetical protein